MKILFFGQEHRNGTTSNMAAVAARLSRNGKKKVVFVQLSGGKDSFEQTFGQNKKNLILREKCDYFLTEGFDSFLEGKPVAREEVKRELRELIAGHLYYFPMGKRELPLLTPAKYRDVLLAVLAELERIADFVFLDCGTVGIHTFDFLKKKEDLVVVNFSQRPESFDAFFLEQYDTAEHFFYLVGNYDSNSIYNRKNLCRLYRMPQKSVGIVPYNPQFQQACERGKLWRYLVGSESYFEQERDRLFRREMDEISKVMLEVAADGT